MATVRKLCHFGCWMLAGKDLISGRNVGREKLVRMHLAGVGWMRILLWDHVWSSQWDVAILVDSLVNWQRLLMIRIVHVRAHLVIKIFLSLFLVPHVAVALNRLLLSLWKFCTLSFENGLGHGNLFMDSVVPIVVIGVSIAPERLILALVSGGCFVTATDIRFTHHRLLVA